MLAERLARGESIISAWSGIADASTVESVTALPFDAVTLDMQHGAHHEGSVQQALLPIIAQRKPALVRIPVGRFDMASRALDFGAESVIAPMINSIEDARRFAASMKYPPLGERSWGAHLAMNRTGRRDPQEWLAGANRSTVALAMVETREAYAIIDDIAAVDGIDGVFVGPSDFSIAWFGGARIDPLSEEMMEAIACIAQRATAAGKFAGIYVTDPRTVGRFHGMGYRLFAMGNEQVYMAQGANNLLSAARESLPKA
jgi:4-hydroxy-2-oxoheptanedioate aldolase